uniref:UPF0326 protein At4g17486 family n=1 Tax=Cajanus cajan TaxID=3821 RepID=A0A151TF03_CAJCA|nr:UPF0326 protein At4g17486 family [Cajanus cajan]
MALSNFGGLFHFTLSSSGYPLLQYKRDKSVTPFCIFSKVKSAGNIPGNTPVYLNVYDLTTVNGYMFWAGLGIFHSGVEVYGVEYAFGAHDYPTSGVFEVEPRQCPGFKFRKSIFMGTTSLDPFQIREFMERQSANFNGDTYHLIVKNCNHFCEDICYKLTGNSIPKWVNRLARIGSFCNCILPEALKTSTVQHDPNVQGCEIQAPWIFLERILDMKGEEEELKMLEFLKLEAPKLMEQMIVHKVPNLEAFVRTLDPRRLKWTSRPNSLPGTGHFKSETGRSGIRECLENEVGERVVPIGERVVPIGEWAVLVWRTGRSRGRTGRSGGRTDRSGNRTGRSAGFENGPFQLRNLGRFEGSKTGVPILERAVPVDQGEFGGRDQEIPVLVQPLFIQVRKIRLRVTSRMPTVKLWILAFDFNFREGNLHSSCSTFNFIGRVLEKTQKKHDEKHLRSTSHNEEDHTSSSVIRKAHGVIKDTKRREKNTRARIHKSKLHVSRQTQKKHDEKHLRSTSHNEEDHTSSSVIRKAHGVIKDTKRREKNTRARIHKSKLHVSRQGRGSIRFLGVNTVRIEVLNYNTAVLNSIRPY